MSCHCRSCARHSSSAGHAERLSVPDSRFALSAGTAFTISSITSRQSPTIGTSGRRTLPSSAGSMSTWMIFASGANAPTLPVTRSSKREPSAISKSAFCIAVTAV